MNDPVAPARTQAQETEGPITSPHQVDPSLSSDVDTAGYDSDVVDSDWVNNPQAQDAGFSAPDETGYADSSYADSGYADSGFGESEAAMDESVGVDF
jgi:hypothetical protein